MHIEADHAFNRQLDALPLERFTADLGTDDLEDLAAKYDTLESLTRNGYWPDIICNALTGIACRPKDAIIAAPLKTESDYRGKTRLLAVYFADPEQHEVPEAIRQVAAECAAFYHHA